ncbi:MAG: type II toxin-antitoxin system RelE/ParE family toxin [Methylococcaceae bacterium]|nr:type II toxin-antitoxin system RelE/ParE family toxin [Methylococcaceae bacterium]
MVNWTDHALSQLHHLHDYIAQDSSLYAKRVSDSIVRKTIGLDMLPYKGRKVAELNEEFVRELEISSWRIIYEVKRDDIDILAVIHKRQDLQVGDIPRK